RGNGIAENDGATAPDIERFAMFYCLANAEGNGDQVGNQGAPQAERDRHRYALDNQVDDRLVLVVGLAEIKRSVILYHQPEAFVCRLVETVQLLDALDQFRRQALRTAIGT